MDNTNELSVADILDAIERTQRESIGCGEQDERDDFSRKLYALDRELSAARRIGRTS